MNNEYSTATANSSAYMFIKGYFLLFDLKKINVLKLKIRCFPFPIANAVMENDKSMILFMM